jgi:hypothetical protein
MSNNEYYIGVREAHYAMAKLLDRRVGKVRGAIVDSIRSACKELGIKKTEQGVKIEFYSVDKDTLDDLLDPAWLAMNKISSDQGCKPLVTVDKQVLTKNLHRVNSKYSNRMPKEEYRKYKAELATALTNSINVVGKDLTRREVLNKRRSMGR